jgi:hypothetical protein
MAQVGDEAVSSNPIPNPQKAHGININGSSEFL